MSVKTPNTVVKYVTADSDFYLFVRNGLGNYERVEVFNADYHRQMASYYVFDLASGNPTGSISGSVSAGGAKNSYLIKRTLAENITIGDTNSPIIIFDADVRVKSAAAVGGGIAVTLANDAIITVSSNTAQFIVEGESAIDMTAFLTAYGVAGFNAKIVFDAAPTDLNIDEDADGSDTAILIGTVSVSDSDDSAMTYSLSSAVDGQGNAVTGFYIADGSSGAITYTGNNLDADAAGGERITLTVTASDGTNSAQQQVIVAVNNVDDAAPSGFIVPSFVTISENAAVNDVILTLPIAIPDIAGSTVTYSMAAAGAAYFTFDAVNRELKIKDGVVFAANETYGLIFTAQTNAGALATQTVTVTVLADQSSSVTFGTDDVITEITVSENEGGAIINTAATGGAVGSTVNYTLTTGDAYFTIDTSGDIRFRDDFEFDNLADDVTMPLVVTIRAFDGFGSDERTLHITVTDENDIAPSLDISSITVDAGFNDDVTLTTDHLHYSDADSAVVADTIISYTIEGLPDGITVKKIDTENDTETVLSVSDSFTQADVIAGDIVLTIDETKTLVGFSLSASDGVQSSAAQDFVILTRTDLYVDDVGGNNTLNYLDKPALAYKINSGYGRDEITGSDGDDVITAGRGDDNIILNGSDDATNSGGRDIIIYEYDARNKVATDGGDVVTGFKRGEDKFILSTKSFAETPEEALEQVGGSNKDSFADDQFIVTPDLKFTGGVASVTGITLVFRENQTSSSGRMSDNSVQIVFDEALTWDEFLAAIVHEGDANFDYNHLAIKNASVLPALLGENSSDFMLDRQTGIVVTTLATMVDEIAESDTLVATLYVANNSGADFIYSINDETRFEIRNGNELYFKAGIYQADIVNGVLPTTSYEVEITGANGNETLPAAIFTVGINDIHDEKPILSVASTATIAEDAVMGDVVLTAQVTADVEDSVVSYVLGGTDAASFEIDENGVVRFTANSALDFESGQEPYSITITATAEKDNRSESSDPATVVITVTNSDEIAPVMTPISSGPYSITENITGKTDTGFTFSVFDADNVGTAITFSVSETGGGTGGDKFEVVAGVGKDIYKLIAKAGQDFDADTKASYALDIIASDGVNSSAVLSVAVAVGDVDDNPLKFGGAVSGTFVDGDPEAPTGTLTLKDEDISAVTPPDLSGETQTGTYGTLTFGGEGNLTWTYTPKTDADTAAFILSLGADDTIKETFSVAVGTGENKISQDIEITVRGKTDTPTLTATKPDADADAVSVGRTVTITDDITHWNNDNAPAPYAEIDATVENGLAHFLNDGMTDNIINEYFYAKLNGQPVATVTFSWDEEYTTAAGAEIAAYVLFNSGFSDTKVFLYRDGVETGTATFAQNDTNAVSDIYAISLPVGITFDEIILEFPSTKDIITREIEIVTETGGNNIAITAALDDTVTRWKGSVADTDYNGQKDNLTDGLKVTTADDPNAYSFHVSQATGKTLTFEWGENYTGGDFILYNPDGSDENSSNIDGSSVQFYLGGNEVGTALMLNSSAQDADNKITVSTTETFDKVVLTFAKDEQSFSEIEIIDSDNTNIAKTATIDDSEITHWLEYDPSVFEVAANSNNNEAGTLVDGVTAHIGGEDYAFHARQADGKQITFTLDADHTGGEFILYNADGEAAANIDGSAVKFYLSDGVTPLAELNPIETLTLDSSDQSDDDTITVKLTDTTAAFNTVVLTFTGDEQTLREIDIKGAPVNVTIAEDAVAADSGILYTFNAVGDGLLNVTKSNFLVTEGNDTEASSNFMIEANNNGGDNSGGDAFKLVVKPNAEFDYETKRSYKLKIDVIDIDDVNKPSIIDDAVTLTINISDADDNPATIDRVTFDDALGVTHGGAETTTGKLIFTDADTYPENVSLTDAKAYLYDGDNTSQTLKGTYGTLTLGALDGTYKQAWTYEIDGEDIDTINLGKGEVATDSFTVSTEGGALKTIAVTVTGRDDGPILTLHELPTDIKNVALATNGGKAVTSEGIDTWVVVGIDSSIDQTYTLIDGAVGTAEASSRTYFAKGVNDTAGVDYDIISNRDTITFTLDSAYQGGSFILHNRIDTDPEFSARIDGSTVQFRLLSDDGLSFKNVGDPFELQSANQQGDSNAITVALSGADQSEMFNQVVLTFKNAGSQNFSEVEIFGTNFDAAVVAIDLDEDFDTGAVKDTGYAFIYDDYDDTAAADVATPSGDDATFTVFVDDGDGDPSNDVESTFFAVMKVGNFYKLHITADADFDYETTSSYNLKVIADDNETTDTTGQSGEAFYMTVNIGDTNDTVTIASAFTNSSATTATHGGIETVTGTLSVTDADGANSGFQDFSLESDNIVSIVGTYGALSLGAAVVEVVDGKSVATRTWTYELDVLNQNTIDLTADSEGITDVFTLIASDGGDETVITINVVGEDDNAKLASRRAVTNIASGVTPESDITTRYNDDFPIVLSSLTDGTKGSTQPDVIGFVVKPQDNSDNAADPGSSLTFDLGADQSYLGGEIVLYGIADTESAFAAYNFVGSVVQFIKDDTVVGSFTLAENNFDAESDTISLSLNDALAFNKVVIDFAVSSDPVDGIFLSEIEILGYHEVSELTENDNTKKDIGYEIVYVAENNAATTLSKFADITSTTIDPTTGVAFTDSDINDLFAIEAVAGKTNVFKLVKKAGSSFDFETLSSYTLNIRNLDAGTVTIVVDVVDIDETPIIGGTLVGTTTERDTGSIGGTITVSDVDTLASGLKSTEVTATSSLAGTYGNFVLTDNVWTYALDDSLQATKDLTDAGGIDTLDIKTGLAGNEVTATIMVNINGFDDELEIFADNKKTIENLATNETISDNITYWNNDDAVSVYSKVASTKENGLTKYLTNGDTAQSSGKYFYAVLVPYAGKSFEVNFRWDEEYAAVEGAKIVAYLDDKSDLDGVGIDLYNGGAKVGATSFVRDDDLTPDPDSATFTISLPTGITFDRVKLSLPAQNVEVAEIRIFTETGGTNIAPSATLDDNVPRWYKAGTGAFFDTDSNTQTDHLVDGQKVTAANDPNSYSFHAADAVNKRVAFNWGEDVSHAGGDFILYNPDESDENSANIDGTSVTFYNGGKEDENIVDTKFLYVSTQDPVTNTITVSTTQTFDRVLMVFAKTEQTFSEVEVISGGENVAPDAGISYYITSWIEYNADAFLIKANNSNNETPNLVDGEHAATGDAAHSFYAREADGKKVTFTLETPYSSGKFTLYNIDDEDGDSSNINGSTVQFYLGDDLVDSAFTLYRNAADAVADTNADSSARVIQNPDNDTIEVILTDTEAAFDKVVLTFANDVQTFSEIEITGKLIFSIFEDSTPDYDIGYTISYSDEATFTEDNFTVKSFVTVENTAENNQTGRLVDGEKSARIDSIDSYSFYAVNTGEKTISFSWNETYTGGDFILYNPNTADARSRNIDGSTVQFYDGTSLVETLTLNSSNQLADNTIKLSTALAFNKITLTFAGNEQTFSEIEIIDSDNNNIAKTATIDDSDITHWKEAGDLSNNFEVNLIEETETFELAIKSGAVFDVDGPDAQARYDLFIEAADANHSDALIMTVNVNPADDEAPVVAIVANSDTDEYPNNNIYSVTDDGNETATGKVVVSDLDNRAEHRQLGIKETSIAGIYGTLTLSYDDDETVVNGVTTGTTTWSYQLGVTDDQTAALAALLAGKAKHDVDTFTLNAESGSSSAEISIVVTSSEVLDSLGIISRDHGSFAKSGSQSAGEVFHTMKSDTGGVIWSINANDEDESSLVQIDAATGAISFIEDYTPSTAAKNAPFNFTVTATGQGVDETATQLITYRFVNKAFIERGEIHTYTNGDDVVVLGGDYNTAKLGDGNDTFTQNKAAGLIAVGRGQDTIYLSHDSTNAHRQDTILLRFNDGCEADGTADGWRLYDGGLTINSFERNIDELILVDISKDNAVNSEYHFFQQFADEGGHVTVTVANNRISSVSLHFKYGGDDDVAESNVVTVKFRGGGSQTYSNIANKFEDDGETITLKASQHSFIDDIFYFAGDSFNVIDQQELDIFGFEIDIV